MTGFDWSIVRDVGIGVGMLLFGIGVLWGMGALAKTLARVNQTLDEVDTQLASVGKPVSETLKHVGGIADTADQTLAKLTTVVGTLEDVAGQVSQTAALAKETLSPAIVNVGATITGVSAGLRRLVMGKNNPPGDS